MISYRKLDGDSEYYGRYNGQNLKKCMDSEVIAVFLLTKCHTKVSNLVKTVELFKQTLDKHGSLSERDMQFAMMNGGKVFMKYYRVNNEIYKNSRFRYG